MVPIEATAMPLPTELTTPPVTNMYFDIKEYHKLFGRNEITIGLTERQNLVRIISNIKKRTLSSVFSLIQVYF
jgi:hypothetical protein